MRFLVDCDLVLVQTDIMWWNYLYEEALNGNGNLPSVNFHQATEYNLNKYFNVEDGFINFWGKPDLYDNATPVHRSVRALKSLHKSGNEVVICSVISGNHYESKKNFINRKYPFAMFVGTEHKSLIETDVVIDDRSDNLIKFSEGTQKVLYKTKYKQNYDVSGFIHMAGW